MFKNKTGRLNRKGNIEDIGTAALILLGLVFAFFLSYTVLDQFDTNIQGIAAVNSTTAATSFLSTYKTKFSNAWDYGVLFLAIMLPLFSYFAAQKIPINRTMMIVMFFATGFILLGTMIVANIYGGFMDNTLFAAWADNLVIIPRLMPNLLYYGLFYTLIIWVGLFAKDDKK